jgi:small-conductance mechanosensitive channel
VISQIWERWKNVRDNDPVKARLVRVLTLAAVVVTPFLTAWVWKGFAYAAGMLMSLVIMGMAIAVAALVINRLFGWAACYVFTGKLPEFDDWLDSTIMDEWESYQNHKYKASLRPKPHAPVSQTQVGGEDNSQKYDSGPDWLRK